MICDPSKNCPSFLTKWLKYNLFRLTLYLSHIVWKGGPVSLFYVTHLLDTIQLVDLRVHDPIFQSLPRNLSPLCNLFCKEAVSSSSEASPRTSFPLKVFQWDVSLHKWTKNKLFWCCILSRLGSHLGTCLYSTIVPTHFTLYVGVTSIKFSGF